MANHKGRGQNKGGVRFSASDKFKTPIHIFDNREDLPDDRRSRPGGSADFGQHKVHPGGPPKIGQDSNSEPRVRTGAAVQVSAGV